MTSGNDAKDENQTPQFPEDIGVGAFSANLDSVLANLAKLDEEQKVPQAKPQPQPQSQPQPEDIDVKSIDASFGDRVASFMADCERNAQPQDILNQKITAYLPGTYKKPATKDEHLVAFKRGFLKLYDNLTADQISKLDKFIAEHVAKEDAKYFPSGKFDVLEAKYRCALTLGLPPTDKVGKIEMYLDTPVIPPEFQGVETLKDLINKYSELYKNYSAETAGKAKAEKDLADAKAKQEKAVKDLEAGKNKLAADNKDLTDKYTKSEGAKKTLEGELANCKAKFKQAEDKAVALEKEAKESRKCFVNADARVADLCDDLHNLIYVFDNSKMNSDGKLNIYSTYLNMKCPKDPYVAGAVHNNIGQILGNKRKDYEAAKVHFEEALKYAEKECAANPRSDKAKERREKYERNLKNCEHNLQMLVLTADTPVADKPAE